jgi:hypothetical protein
LIGVGTRESDTLHTKIDGHGGVPPLHDGGR